MDTGGLIDLFALEGSGGSPVRTADVKQPQQKRKKIEPSAEEWAGEPSGGGEWSLEELWDSSSQYEEQHSLENFIGNVGKIL